MDITEKSRHPSTDQDQHSSALICDTYLLMFAWNFLYSLTDDVVVYFENIHCIVLIFRLCNIVISTSNSN